MEDKPLNVNDLMRTLQAIPIGFPVMSKGFGEYVEVTSSPFEIKKVSRIKFDATGDEMIVDSEICDALHKSIKYTVLETRTVVVLKGEQ